MDGNEIKLFLENSNDIQDAIDTLSNSILKADKIPNNTEEHRGRFFCVYFEIYTR